MDTVPLRTGVNPVEIVEVRCETKPLNCPFDVFLDVSCRVGHGSSSREHVKSAFRRNYTAISRQRSYIIQHRDTSVLTKKLVANIVLLYKVAKQPFICTTLVGDLEPAAVSSNTSSAHY